MGSRVAPLRWLATARRRIEAAVPFARYAVEGASMEPSYRAGERLLVDRRAYRRRPPAVGDVVVLHDPAEPRRYLVKRIAKAPDGVDPGPSAVWVLGDNAAASRDSRAFGAVPRSAIIGRVWFRY